MKFYQLWRVIAMTLFLTLVVSGCTAQRQTGHEVDSGDQKNVSQSEKTSSASQKDTPDEQEGKSESSVSKPSSDMKSNTSKIICIDAGHQRYADNTLEQIGPGSSIKKPKVTSGTQGKYTNKAESEVNLETAMKLKKILVSRGYQVVMVRESLDVNISNKQRAEIANKNHCDLTIRIHCDGSGNSSLHGYFILTPSSSNKFLSSSIVNASLKLTKCLLPAIQKTTGAYNRGISYRDDLTGTNWSKVPTVLVEMGEMSNKEEDYALSTSSYQEKMAMGMANGIDDYFRQ